MKKTLIIISTVCFLFVIVSLILFLILFLTKKKLCPGDGTCSGNGTCDTKSGKCNCEAKYTGDNCDNVSCDCSGNGDCDETGKCKCIGNFVGTNCEKCKDGWSGNNCDVCWCKNDGTCNDDGSCTCIGNYDGENCEKCKDGWSGNNCEGRRLVAVGGIGANVIVYSDDDAITWNKFGDNIDVGGLVRLNGIVWNGKILVGVGNPGKNGNTIVYSSDKGKTWTGTGSTIFSNGLSISYGNNTFIAGGTGANSIAYSKDGLNWTGIGNVFGYNSIVSGISYGGTTFVAVGTGTNNSIAFASYKTLIWISGTYDSINNLPIYYAVAYGKDIFVAVGKDNNGNGIIVSSSDGGQNWSIHTQTNFSFTNIIWSEENSVFVAIGIGTKIGYSYNGIDWFAVNAKGLDAATSLVCSGSRIIITGSNTNAYSYNGKEWTYETTKTRYSYAAIISIE